MGQAFDPDHPAPDEGMGKKGEEAFKWYMKAAEAGFPAGQDGVGKCYEKGIGVKKDLAKAIEWYEKAGAAGYSSSLFSLGNIYLESEKPVKNETRAMEYFCQGRGSGAHCRHDDGSDATQREQA